MTAAATLKPVRLYPIPNADAYPEGSLLIDARNSFACTDVLERFWDARSSAHRGKMPPVSETGGVDRWVYSMQFLLIISHDDQFEPSRALVAEIVAWTKQQRRQRILLDSNPLVPAAEAVTVRVRRGRVVAKPGPFARSREKMCAYALVEARNRKAAVAIAASHPMAAVATIEVRAVWSALR